MISQEIMCNAGHARFTRESDKRGVLQGSQDRFISPRCSRISLGIIAGAPLLAEACHGGHSLSDTREQLQQAVATARNFATGNHEQDLDT